LSLLACDRDPGDLGVVVDGYWDIEALSDHLSECRACRCLQDAIAASSL